MSLRDRFTKTAPPPPSAPPIPGDNGSAVPVPTPRPTARTETPFVRSPNTSTPNHAFQELKTRLHSAVIDSLDLSKIGQLTPEQVQQVEQHKKEMKEHWEQKQQQAAPAPTKPSN